MDYVNGLMGRASTISHYNGCCDGCPFYKLLKLLFPLFNHY